MDPRVIPILNPVAAALAVLEHAENNTHNLVEPDRVINDSARALLKVTAKALLELAAGPGADNPHDATGAAADVAPPAADPAADLAKVGIDVDPEAKPDEVIMLGDTPAADAADKKHAAHAPKKHRKH